MLITGLLAIPAASGLLQSKPSPSLEPISSWSPVDLEPPEEADWWPGGEHDQLEAKCSLHLGQTPEDSLALGIWKAAALAGPVVLLLLSQSWG